MNAHIVDGQNVGMIQPACGLRLELEAAHAVGVLGEGAGEDFDGDFAFQARVAGTIDFTHPACADERTNLIGSDVSSGCKRHE